MHPALWNKRVLGANKGLDATAEDFPPLTVLPRIGKRFCLPRQNCWRMDLPQQQQGVAKTGVQLIQEHVQRRRDAIVEHAKTRNMCEKCKNSEMAGATKTCCRGSLR
jgi:hypothetical protein